MSTTSSAGSVGEEFIAIVPGGLESVSKIAERVRSGFEVAGATIGTHTVGATVSIGAAISYDPVTAIDPLVARADAALYRAKHDGRNRLQVAEEEMASEQAQLIAAARAQWGRARLPVCRNTRRPSDTLIQAKQSNHGRCNLSFTLSAV